MFQHLDAQLMAELLVFLWWVALVYVVASLINIYIEAKVKQLDEEKS